VAVRPEGASHGGCGGHLVTGLRFDVMAGRCECRCADNHPALPGLPALCTGGRDVGFVGWRVCQPCHDVLRELVL
jgi:hypothetical protein